MANERGRPSPCAPRLLLAATATLCVALATPARAYDFGVLKSKAERLVDQAADARKRGEHDLAESLLAEAESEEGRSLPAVLHQRGLLARDRGALEEAVRQLRDAADADRESTARVDQAGVLVALGRWPEAVTVLRQAFDEAGSELPVQQLTSDPRFVKLARFAPYEELLAEVRAEQAGPIGRLLLRLDRLESTARVTRDVLGQAAAVLGAAGRVLGAVGTPVVIFVLLGFLLTFGANQIGLLRPPWTLVIGMGSAALLWHFAARIATADTSSGWSTIGVGLGVVFAPWLTLGGGAALWRWLRRWRNARLDPFGEARLLETLSLLDEVSRVAHGLLAATGAERESLQAELEKKARALQERLDRGVD